MRCAWVFGLIWDILLFLIELCDFYIHLFIPDFVVFVFL